MLYESRMRCLGTFAVEAQSILKPEGPSFGITEESELRDKEYEREYARRSQGKCNFEGKRRDFSRARRRCVIRRTLNTTFYSGRRSVRNIYFYSDARFERTFRSQCELDTLRLRRFPLNMVSLNHISYYNANIIVFRTDRRETKKFSRISSRK